MDRNRFFWGILIVFLGVMLLFNTLGILTVNAWQIFWPIILVLFGVWMLFGPYLFRHSANPQNLSIPLEGAARLKIKVKHGAGRLHIGSNAADSPDALTGIFLGGVDTNSHNDGAELKVKLKTPSDFMLGIAGIGGFEGYSWDFNLSRNIPISLDIRSGANEANLDLHDLKVSELDIKTGASSTQIILPASAGFTSGSIRTGASSVQIQVPEGVAGQFEIKHGLAGIHVDPSRFKNNGNVFESAGFAFATNRVQMTIETGVGTVEIR